MGKCKRWRGRGHNIYVAMVGQWLLRLEVRNLESLPLPALFSMGMRDMSGKGRTEPVKETARR